MGSRSQDTTRGFQQQPSGAGKYDLATRRSWASLRPSTYTASVYSVDSDVSPMTTTRPHAPQSQPPVSPLSTNTKTRRRNSPVSALVEPITFDRTEEARKGSDATVWPSNNPGIRKSLLAQKQKENRGTQDTWKIGELYREARGIYKTGPKGEGQKLWRSYKTVQTVKKAQAEIRKNMAEEETVERRPSAGLAAHPPSRITSVDMPVASGTGKASVITPDVRKASQTKASSGKGKAPAATFLDYKDAELPPPPPPTKESEVSRSSYDIPISIHPKDTQQFVDTTKPLPRVPRLDPAPKPRLQAESKALPLVPHPSIPKVNPKPNKSTAARPAVKNAFVSSTSTSTATKPTHRGGWIPSHSHTSPTSREPPTKLKLGAFEWWKPLPAAMASTKYNADRPTNKPKISRPRPISDLQSGITANVPAAMGGVGGPSTLRGAPRRQGKKENLWGMGQGMGQGRKDSEVSFQCAGPSRNGRFDADVPSPLFSDRGRGSGSSRGRGSESSSVRDTRFYQPYVEVLEEYDGRYDERYKR
jgi:hypothetical protein